MNHKTLAEALSQAERFATMARALVKHHDKETYWSPSKETGAVKRASLDLTRALADMRRPS